MASFSKKQFISDTVIYTIGGSLPQVLNFLLLPIYSRLLAPSEFGILGYVSSITAFLTITNSLSLNSYYLRYYFESQDKKKFTGSIFYFLTITNLSLIILEGAALNFLFKKTNVQVPFYPYMLLGLAECLFSSLALIPLRQYRLEFKSKNYVLCTSSTVLLTHIISLVLITRFNMGAEGRLLGSAAAAAILGVYYIFHIKNIAVARIDFTLIKNGLKFSLPLLIGSYASMALSISDRLILERWVAMAAIGVYSVSYAISNIASLVISSFSFVLEPLVYKISVLNKETFLQEYLRLKDYFFFIVYIIAGGIMIFAKDIVRIFLTAKFLEAESIIPLIALSSVFAGGYTIFGQLLMVKNKTFKISLGTIVAAILSITLNLILIPVWGIRGAAMTIIAAQLSAMLIAYIAAARSFSSFLEILKEISALSVLIAAEYLILPLINTTTISTGNPLYTIFIIKFLLYICYTAALFRLYNINFNSFIKNLNPYAGQ